MPAKYCSNKTVRERHKKWSERGVWKAIMDSLVSRGYQTGLVDADDLSVDSSSTVAAKKGGQGVGFDGRKRIKCSKIHATITPISLPVAIDHGPGDEHESRRLFPLLMSIRIRSTRRPRTRPKRVYADTKYHTPLVMMYHLAARGIAARINERANKKRRPIRPRIFDHETYTQVRNSVERFSSWLKSFRRIQTRHDRLSSTYLGFLQLGCGMILMKRVSR